jgi:MFS family permease
VLGRYLDLLRDLPRDARLYLAAEVPLAVGAGVFAAVYGLYVLSLGHGPTFLGVLLTGALADRAGPRTVLLGGCVEAAAGAGVQLVTGEPRLLLASSVVAGVGTGAVTLAAAPFLAQHAPPGRGAEVFTLDLVAVLAGRMAGSVAGGYLATRLPLPDGAPAADRYWLTLLCAAAFALVAFAALLLTREGPRPASRATLDRDGLTPGPGRRGAGRPAGGHDPGAGAGPGPGGRTDGGRCPARLGAHAAPDGFAPGVAVLGAALLCRRALIHMASPVLTALTMDALPAEMRGAGNAVVWLGLNGAAGLSTLAGGALIAALGYRPPYVLAAALYTAAALLLLRWFARPARDVLRTPAPQRPFAAVPVPAGRLTGAGPAFALRGVPGVP